MLSEIKSLTEMTKTTLAMARTTTKTTTTAFNSKKIDDNIDNLNEYISVIHHVLLNFGKNYDISDKYNNKNFNQ